MDRHGTIEEFFAIVDLIPLAQSDSTCTPRTLGTTTGRISARVNLARFTSAFFSNLYKLEKNAKNLFY